MSAKRFDVIARVLREHLDAPPTTGAEIGVYNGDTTCELLKVFPALSMVCVDPWVGYNGYCDYGTKELEGEFRTFERTVLDVFPGRVRVLKLMSCDAAVRVSDGTLDFVFIDANHSYPSVRGDILVWEPKLRQGGIMFGHDYSNGVARAVNEIFGDQVHSDEDMMWWVQVGDPAVISEAR